LVKMRHAGGVENRAVFVAIGVTQEGAKEVLGLWTGATEGARLWLQILTELRQRGLKDTLNACVVGLKGFPEAIEAAFPKITVQLCIVKMVRNSLAYASWKERNVPRCPQLATSLNHFMLLYANRIEAAWQRPPNTCSTADPAT
jgi:putative transposase